METEMFKLYNLLPKLGRESEGGYNIGWELPGFYKKYAGKIAQCPCLQQGIAEKCRTILNDSPLDIDWVELKFYKQGLIIDVGPGDACGIYPDERSYVSHNIDTASQGFILLALGLVAMEEIYRAMMVWENNSEAGLEGESRDRTYRLEKSPASKRFKFYEVYDEEKEEDVGLIAARTRQEAETAASNLYGNSCYRVSEESFNEPRAFSTLKIFEVFVIFENGLRRRYEVFAAKSYLAEELVEEELDRQPLIWPIKKIEVVGESRPLKPMVGRESALYRALSGSTI